MKDPKDYFNAGVMVYNLKKMRELDISKKLFEGLQEIKEPIFQDQDILNSVFYRNGGVKLISNKYNMYNTPDLFSITKTKIFFNELQKRFGLLNRNKKLYYIYHYVGGQKPWKNPNINSELFYYYAKKSPFYREIIEENS